MTTGSGLSLEVLQELEKLIVAGATPKLAPGTDVPVVLVPAGYEAKAMPELKYHKLEPHEIQPTRIKQSVTVLDVPSFCAYHTQFADEHSIVLANEPKREITAILDYHAASGESQGPRWGQHRLTLSMRQGEDWNAWVGANNVKMPQEKFAEFLEQNSFSIKDPSPGAIMDVARDLHASTQAEFSGGRRESGSMNFTYTENTKGTVGNSKMAVPERFTLFISPFIGGVPVDLEVLLRFRLTSGKLEIWYTLVRHEEAMRQAFLQSRMLIVNTLQIDVLNGEAGSPSK